MSYINLLKQRLTLINELFNRFDGGYFKAIVQLFRPALWRIAYICEFPAVA